VNVIQHTRSCSSHWTALCFYFIHQPRASYIAFCSSFSAFCDVMVVKYFLIQEVILADIMIALFMSTRFRCTPTHNVQS